MASIYDISKQFRKDLLSADAQALQTVVQAYGITYAAIMREIDRLILEAEEAKRRGEKVGESWLRRNDRLGILRTQIVFQIKQFADRVDLNLLNGQRVAVELALRESTEQIAIAKEKAQIGFSFNRSPVEAIENLVGTLRDGPVQRLLARFPIQASHDTTNALIEGLALGKGPRETARAVKDSLGTPLNRALTLTRTETIRAHRAASIANYEANSDVVEGWIWTATKTARTCPVCLAMDGRFHLVTDEFASHPNCRCTPRPKIIGVADNVETGSQWFAKQDFETQEKILGPKKAEAYRNGEITLKSLAEVVDSKVWGKGLRERTLDEAKRYVLLASELEESSAFKLRPVKITDAPRLDRVPKRDRFLDPDPDTTLDEMIDEIANVDHEVLLISYNGKNMAYAPLVGTKDAIDIEGIRSLLDDSFNWHNHPNGSFFSPDDVVNLVDVNSRQFGVVVPSGARYSVSRPKAGWPAAYQVEAEMTDALNTFAQKVTDSMTKAQRQGTWRAILRSKMQSRSRFGDKAMIVEE